MLVLSRHRDESVMIGEDVRITVVDIRGDKARLGVDAPLEVPVHRQEVFDAIRRAGSSPGLAMRMAMAVRLHNHIHQIAIEKLDDLSQQEQMELLGVVDAVLGKGVLV